MKEMKLDRKTRYTRKALEDSLVELLKDKPIVRISIKELCENADINRTTFYAHYRDQYDLLRQIEEKTMKSFAEVLDKYNDKRSKRDITEMIEEILNFIAGNSSSIQILLGENGDIGFQKKLFRHFIREERVRKYFSEKLVDEKIIEYWYVFAVYGGIGMIQHWLKNDMAMPISELAKILITLRP